MKNCNMTYQTTLANATAAWMVIGVGALKGMTGMARMIF